MATRIRAAGRLEFGQAVLIFNRPLSLKEAIQKLPKIGEVPVGSARTTLRQGLRQVSTPKKFAIFYGILSTNERKRAERFVIALGILRELLGHYFDMFPEQVCFGYGAYGNPHMPDSLAGI